MRIYAGNLSYEATEDDLQQAFSAFGEVVSVHIVKDKYSGRSKGFGFVEMSSDAQGQAAIDGLKETDLKGRKLNVNTAHERSRNNRDGGRPGGFGRSGNRSGSGRGGRSY